MATQEVINEMVDRGNEAMGRGESAIKAAVAAERTRCLDIIEGFRKYTGRGREDENTLIGMFARGNRNAARCIAAAIRDDVR